MTRRMLAMAALAFSAVMVVFSATIASAEGEPLTRDYSYWYGGAQSKIYTSSLPPATAGRASAQTTRALVVDAARSEYEGRQVIVRPSLGGVRDVWLTASDLALTGTDTVGTIASTNVSFYKVGYVRIRYPSYGYRRKGYEPDPLIPMVLANGERLGWTPGGGYDPSRRAVATSTTQPFYVLFKVPEETVPGLYAGTITISGAGNDGSAIPDVQVPVSLTVYPFSIKKQTLQTHFTIQLPWVKYASSAAHTWVPAGSTGGPGSTTVTETTWYHADQLKGWYQFMADHRLAPNSVIPAWENGSDWAPPDDNGDMVARDEYLLDYVTTGTATTFPGERLNLNSIAMPEYGWPSYVRNPFASSSNSRRAAQYYSTMRSELAPYLSKTHVFIIDEPRAWQRSFLEKYGAFVHRYAPGAKFMSTVPSLEFHNIPPRNVDIFVNRLHFFYRDYPRWIKKIRAAHKRVWLYSHATNWQRETPLYLIDKPLADSRVQGWFAFDTRVDGILYFAVNRWAVPKRLGSGWRDPYKDPRTTWTTWGNSNGDGTLVYPGYSPGQGLYVEGSPPVSSLRMEALRDGIEDYEFMKLVQARFGTATADYYNHKIIGKPRTVVAYGHATFPYWPKYTSYYEKWRRAMAAKLSEPLP